MDSVCKESAGRPKIGGATNSRLHRYMHATGQMIVQSTARQYT